MTFGELKRKDIICIGDGRLLGRVSDLELDPHTGQIRTLIVGQCCSLFSFFHADRNLLNIPYAQIACIGDDVILVSPGGCC